MNDLALHVLDAGSDARALSGCWKLGERQALTLRPNRAGVLRIAHGRVWITFDHVRPDDTVRGGDHFLDAGDILKLQPGQALVMESWSAGQHNAAYFSWDPLPACEGVILSTRPHRVLATAPQWRASVHQPLRDLRLALVLTGSALARLAAGLVVALVGALLSLAPRSVMNAAALRSRPRGE
ncbi:DUF2917 domain-containing protein [Polaromonas sp.]|uniref:DUF2917 domain-containing protein n=1 Tax=Polaromonas sp. TaxID=1869339 RepID=UPI003267BE58